MFGSYFDQWPKTNHALLEPWTELNGVTTRLCGELARENLSAMTQFMQSNAEQFQALGQAKGMEDFVEIQKRWTNEVPPKLQQHAQTMLHTMASGLAEYQKIFQDSVQQASQPLSAVFQARPEQAGDQSYKDKHREHKHRN